jgi:hypothetical protein
MVIGDLNNDSKADLAIANSGSSTVSVLLGKGNGTFDTAINLSVSDYPTSIAGGDLNGDGKLDIAVAHASGHVSILLGNGDGTFVVTTNYVVGRFPRILFIGDLNVDGRLDLITANSSDRTLSVLAGYGDGTFTPAISFATGMSSQSGVIGDFNDDGQLDVAIGSPYTVSVILNQTHVALQTERVANQIAVAWPVFTAGFVLEATTNLFSTSGWIALTNGFSVIDNQRVVTVPAVSGSKFFRLRHP